MDRLSQEGYGSGTLASAIGGAPSLAAKPQQTITDYSWANHASHLSSRFSRPMLTPSDLSATAPQILVIDDSPTVRKIMEVCHRREHISIQTFADGIEALQWFIEHPILLPSLVYLDIELPHMDGFEVARTLRSKPALADIPILMFSSRDKIIDRLKGRLAGAVGYVTKPFREQEILALTRFYLRPEESGAAAK